MHRLEQKPVQGHINHCTADTFNVTHWRRTKGEEIAEEHSSLMREEIIE